jgi:ribosomal protein S18 acetylase RimI-like enzyme
MNSFETVVKKASLQEIKTHLEECSDSFFPPLSSYVNINDYSKKLYKLSSTFEAWENGKLVGLVATYMNDQKKEAYISNVSVLPDYQGKGISKTLLNRTIKEAKIKSYISIKLEVKQDNIKAITLYQKLGFEISRKHIFNNNLEMSLVL